MRLLHLATVGLFLAQDGELRPQRHVDDVYKKGEELVWIFEQDGKRIGYHAFRYEGAVELPETTAHRFTGRVEIDPIPAQEIPRQRYLGELFTDREGHPLKSTLEAQLGDSYSRVEASVDGGKVRAVVHQGQKSKELSIDVPADAYVQANNFIGYYELAVAVAPVAEDWTSDLKLFSTNSLQMLSVHVQRGERLEERPGATTSGWSIADSLGETFEMTDAGRILKIEVPAQKLVIRRSEERPAAFTLERPATASPKKDFKVEPVEIRRDKIVIAGEITRMPPAETDAKKRLPAVFFISGSGNQDRDGMSSGIDLGTHEILDRLTREGFLVLRVDDRDGGEGGSFEDLVADARACVDFLLAREDVDPDRVAIIGHSEGGITAPILAAERPKIAAVVLMAATGRPLADVIVDQNARALDKAGVTGEERERKLAEVRAWIQAVSGNAKIEPQKMPVDYRSLLTVRTWLQGHARQDPIANVRKVAAPVLVLQGGKDFQVSAEKDARALEKALDEAGNKDHRLVVLPDLDHLFKKVEGSESSLSDYFKRRPVDPAFLDLLAGWLKERLEADAGR